MTQSLDMARGTLMTVPIKCIRSVESLCTDSSLLRAVWAMANHDLVTPHQCHRAPDSHEQHRADCKEGELLGLLAITRLWLTGAQSRLSEGPTMLGCNISCTQLARAAKLEAPVLAIGAGLSTWL